jgi:exopolyphosphatase/guanosine-5'-triphosphate,3'-diphosphate pyrophosphatase
VTKTHRHLAAVDIGTNSFHLVVVEVEKKTGKFKILDREKEIVRLGSGAKDMKVLSDDAMNRGIQTLIRFKGIADASGAPIRAVATSAVREAVNQSEFLRRAKSEAGISIGVISGIEEARLIYLGVLQALPVFNKVILCIDIGGGSTEFLLGQKRRVLYANSLKLGAIRLTQRFFPEGKVNSKALKECRKFVAGMLNPVVREIQKHDYETVIGSSGTILSIARMVQQLREGEPPAKMNNVSFTFEELEEVVETLLESETTEERRNLPGLDPARADIIVAGALILEQIFLELGVRSMTVSEFALREGIVLETIEKSSSVPSARHLNDLRYTSILSLAEHFQYEKEHSHHVARIALRLFDQTKRFHALGPREREFLAAAAILHEIGFFISHAMHHRHSYYLIRNAELFGFTDNEKEIIANIARYHRKSHPKPKHEGYGKLAQVDQEIIRKLAGILRIADGLDRTHSSAVRDLTCRRSGDRLTISLHHAKRSSLDLEIWGAERKKNLFEEAYELEVEFKAHRQVRP